VRVLMLTTSYPVTEGSVSGVFVARLASSLSKLCMVNIVAPAPAEACSSNQLSGGAQVKCFAYAPQRWRVLAHAAGGIPAQLAKNKLFFALIPAFLLGFIVSSVRRSFSADVIHANWAISAFPGFIAKTFSGKPLLTTLRGEDVNLQRGGRARVLSFALWASDRVVVVGDDMRADLLDRYPAYADKVTVVKNGVDKLPLRTKHNFNTDGAGLKLIFVGSLIARKNIENTLLALSELKSRGKTFSFSIIGGGNEQPIAELIGSLGLDGHVELLGEQAPSVVEKALAASHIYISSSKHEGRPNGVIEAMAAGCCCLLSYIAGHREVAADSGAVLFPLNEPVFLADALEGLIGDPIRVDELGRRAHGCVTEKYMSWDESAEAYLREFSLLLSRQK